MYYFTVLTFPGGTTDLIQNALLQCCANKFTTYIIIKEFGKSKQNPHLNVVYEVEEDISRHWSSNATRFFKKLYAFHDLPEDQSRLVRTKKCSSPANVIGGYLQKEDLAQILINKGFDIEHLKEEAKAALRKKTKLTIKNAHIFIHDELYPSRMQTDTFEEFSNLISEALEGVPDLIPLIPKLRLIHAVYCCVYHNNYLINFKI
jgi:hypothetical protein